MLFEAFDKNIVHVKGMEVWLNAPFFLLEEQQAFVKNIANSADCYFNKNIIKDDLATTIVEATLGNKQIIIKRINAQNLFTVLRRQFILSRVEKNWKNALILRQHQIDTFLPIALVKKKFLGMCSVSYLYMSKIEGIDAKLYLEKCQKKEDWQDIANKIIALIKKLNNLGIRHRDLNLSNVIISQNKPYLIDLDAMKLDKSLKKKLEKKEVHRFIENINYLKQDNNELFTYFYNALMIE